MDNLMLIPLLIGGALTVTGSFMARNPADPRWSTSVKLLAAGGLVILLCPLVWALQAAFAGDLWALIPFVLVIVVACCYVVWLRPMVRAAGPDDVSTETDTSAVVPRSGDNAGGEPDGGTLPDEAAEEPASTARTVTLRVGVGAVIALGIYGVVRFLSTFGPTAVLIGLPILAVIVAPMVALGVATSRRRRDAQSRVTPVSDEVADRIVTHAADLRVRGYEIRSTSIRTLLFAAIGIALIGAVGYAVRAFAANLPGEDDTSMTSWTTEVFPVIAQVCMIAALCLVGILLLYVVAGPLVLDMIASYHLATLTTAERRAADDRAEGRLRARYSARFPDQLTTGGALRVLSVTAQGHSELIDLPRQRLSDTEMRIRLDELIADLDSAEPDEVEELVEEADFEGAQTMLRILTALSQSAPEDLDFEIISDEDETAAIVASDHEGYVDFPEDLAAAVITTG